MPKDIRLGIGNYRFPDRCVSCGAEPDVAFPIECTRGFDMILLKVWSEFEFEVPCCEECAARRQKLGILIYVGAIAGTFGILFGMFALEPVFKAWGIRDTWLLLTLAGFLGGVYFVRNWLTPVLDANLLGVRGVQLEKQDFAILRFRDEQFALETESMRFEDA